MTRVALESLFSATRDSTRTLRYDLRLDSTRQPVTRDLTTYMARVTNTNYDYFYVSGSRTSFACRTTSCDAAIPLSLAAPIIIIQSKASPVFRALKVARATRSVGRPTDFLGKASRRPSSPI